MENTFLDKLEQLTRLTAEGFDAFLYDCDGTLADNMQAHKNAYVKVCQLHGVELDATLIDELAGWPTVAVAEEICKRYGATFDHHDFARRKSQTFIDDFIEHTQPIPYVVDHLKAHAGKVKIGVVSGGRRSTVSKTLSVLGIDHLLDVLVCADDTERGKPFPDPFLLAAEKLGVDPKRCMVFEDGVPGVEAAKAAGMSWVRIDQL
ncbi:haloacid dehalogenase superfamily, subfamily IA, variant 3 with third motif having DD or ED [Cnuella takakiae]|uniref:Haloacid dehalogenase superfamily, subfamily IA, variant 3 with third motif having DD or ED n=1 Tax=Cnuella takakiae TaxID=1302690 RepID=A0A1M4XXK3_9BACT|nr:HAD family phosphatase [Cnuella takakiae]OLY92981.1 phosphatase [Cnuella takakiae]SHE98211.1 haloacid dehalogenase superfamily, subfamily IA, variant 3 with third motif having DD or ED [Cnuella takakiae]